MASSRPPPPFRSLPPPQPPSTAAVGGRNPLQRTSLYVGDLDPNVTEDDLFNKFSAVATVVSIRLCRCLLTGKSLCYAYVNFYSNYHALKAFALNHADLKGKPVRIMWSQRDPFPRKTGIGNLFVKNLDASINSTLLEGTFCRFGNILSCKVAEENGKSKGFGFVQFDSEESAMAAMTALHDTMLIGKKLYVSKFVRRSKRTTADEEDKFTNLYVKNLLGDMTEDRLKEMFSRYGKIFSAVIMKDDKGISRGFGFVNFLSPDDAKAALEAMNGVQIGSKNLFVGRAQSKAERTKLLKQKYKDAFGRRFEKLKASNLYVKNLNVSIDDKRLQELFGPFGRITSARVMRLENGTSKGFGFVCFSSPEEAMAALHGLNGEFVEGRFLYVAVAQRKEDRCKELQKYYMQHTPVQSPYQYSCNGGTPQFHPFYFKIPPCPAVSPFLFQPSLYQHVGIQYPYSTTHEEQEFSYDQMRHLHPSIYSQHTMAYNSNVGIRELGPSNFGTEKVGFRRRGIKRCEPTENYSVALPAVQSVTAVNLKPKTCREEAQDSLWR